MNQVIDFDKEMSRTGMYVGMLFSEDQKTALTLFLFEGLKPGGHLEAMFAQDYHRAMYNADIHSRTVFWATARWISDNAPAACQGSYEAVDFWCKSPELRAKYRLECEQKAIWDALNEQ